MKLMKCCLTAIGVVTLFSGFAECANYEVNTRRGNIPGYYIRSEMQEADRAVEAARSAGKDKACPAEFKAAEDAKDKAYDVFRACHTEEGAALAKKATAMANALCPYVAPPSPTVSLSVDPASVKQGDCANLTWSSTNASNVSIDQGIGKVDPSGSKQVCPGKTTPYTISVAGEGGSQTATKTVNVLPSPTASLSADPASVKQNRCATLTWSSTNASSASIDHGVGNVDLNGSKEVCPASTTLYTMTVAGEGGSKSVATTVNVIPLSKKTMAFDAVALFDVDKAVLKPKGKEQINKYREEAKAELSRADKIMITGHTDNTGSVDHNMKLSVRRAESVRDYLVGLGIDPNKLVVKGEGEAKPLADNRTAEGRAKNRRVEVDIIGVEK
mgnify:FL=1